MGGDPYTTTYPLDLDSHGIAVGTEGGSILCATKDEKTTEGRRTTNNDVVRKMPPREDLVAGEMTSYAEYNKNKRTTCPKLAAATGSGVMKLKTSSTGLPSSLSIVSYAILESKLGTLSHNFCNSTMLRGLRMSGRMDNAFFVLD